MSKIKISVEREDENNICNLSGEIGPENAHEIHEVFTEKTPAAIVFADGETVDFLSGDICTVVSRALALLDFLSPTERKMFCETYGIAQRGSSNATAFSPMK